MKRLLLLLIALAVLASALTGCGQKGPLYKAEDRPESAQPLGGDRLDGDTENDDSSKDDDQE